jgi:hypothetical protein
MPPFIAKFSLYEDYFEEKVHPEQKTDEPNIAVKF